jgi:hypothetical protein
MLHVANATLSGSVIESNRDHTGSYIVIAVNRDPNQPMYFRVYAHGKLKDRFNFIVRKGDAIRVEATIVVKNNGVFYNVNNMHQITIETQSNIQEMQKRFSQLDQAGF